MWYKAMIAVWVIFLGIGGYFYAVKEGGTTAMALIVIGMLGLFVSVWELLGSRQKRENADGKSEVVNSEVAEVATDTVATPATAKAGEAVAAQSAAADTPVQQ